MRENECENRVFFARYSREFAAYSFFALPPQSQRKPVVGVEHFVGHRCTVACEKGAVSFHGHPYFVFLEFLEIIPTL